MDIISLLEEYKNKASKHGSYTEDGDSKNGNKS